MRKLVDKVKLNLHKISSPSLLIHSKIDQTALFENFEIVKQSLHNTNPETLIVNEAEHNLFDTDGNDKMIIFDTVDNFIKDKFDV